jgi:hypothetical protein
MIALDRKSPRKAFLLVTSSKWLNKPLLALHDLKYRRRPQSFEIFYV